jgi:hypothetical protein
MRNLSAAALALSAFLLVPLAHAGDRHVWQVSSPHHEQTFTFGSERNRAWVQRGAHLGIVIHFTNDPYVDRIEPRLYDDFSFDFPNVRLGKDGHIFYYHPSDGKAVAVAEKYPGLFGQQVRLLPSSFLVIDKPHGWLTLTLVVTDHPDVADAE